MNGQGFPSLDGGARPHEGNSSEREASIQTVGSVGVPRPPSRTPGVVVATGTVTVGGTVVARESSPQPQQPQPARPLGTPVSPSPVASRGSAGASPLTSAAAVQGVVMLAHPLVMQATVLRNPDWLEQSRTPELVEPGDILYKVLRIPQLACGSDEGGGVGVGQTPTFGVQPFLSLPDKVGTYVTRESFKALLCFQNTATYPLSSMLFRVDVGVPPSPPSAEPQRVSLVTADVPALAGKANYTFPIEVPLVTVGTYTLSVHVFYTDPTQASRKLSWASTFPVEQAVTETAQRVLWRVPLPQRRDIAAAVKEGEEEEGGEAEEDLYSALFGEQRTPRPTTGAPSCGPSVPTRRRRRPPVLTLEDALKDWRLPRCLYALTVGLRNTCSVPIVLSDVRLKLQEQCRPFIALLENAPVGVVRRDAAAAAAAPSAVHVQQQQQQQHSLVSSDAHHVQPGEQREYTFHFLIRPAALAYSPAMSLQQPSSSSGGGAGGGGGGGGASLGGNTANVGLLEPSIAAGIGCVEWTWRRLNGDGGVERSRLIKLGRIRATPELDLCVLRVRPAGPTAEPAVSELRAGRPLEVELCLCYSPQPLSKQRHSAPSVGATEGSSTHLLASPPPPSSPLDVALKVRPEKLAPHFLYLGPGLRRLGPLEAGKPLVFSLTLLPWQSGLLPLARDSVHIVSASAPEVILWPAASPDSPLSPLASSSAHHGVVEAAATHVRTGSSLFPDRFLVPAATGTVLAQGNGNGNGNSVLTAATASSAAMGGNGTAPAVAAVPVQVMNDMEEGELCEVLVR